MLPVLYIGNKNYSSWSLRPWLLLREVGFAFEERLLPFGDDSAWGPFRARRPPGKVPALEEGEQLVWDSLAIVEHVYESHPAVWPNDRAARAWARSASAEMHSGFTTLRERCGMNVGIRVRLHEIPDSLRRDVARIDALWSEGLGRFGGPFLAGGRFTAVDAFFAPVAFRVQTYGLELGADAAAYAVRLLERPWMRAWYEAGLAEPWRDAAHEDECRTFGTVVEDFRAG